MEKILVRLIEVAQDPSATICLALLLSLIALIIVLLR